MKQSTFYLLRSIFLYSAGFFMASFLFHRLMGSDVAWRELALQAPFVGCCIYLGVRYKQRRHKQEE